ncbi:MAG: hypothetical protein HY791_34110 [Deltaproteobacteria bacterium]|nr:hypothetical protein [Deltaproteobacteria bacterium]
MRSWVALGLAALLGCRGSDFLEVDGDLIPDEVVWLAVVPQLPGTGSGLVPREDVAGIAAFGLSPEAALLIGFTDEQLPAQRPGELDLRARRLGPAEPGESRLPPPAFAARLDAPDRPIELEYQVRASWMPNCPLILAEPSLVDADCNACAAVATQTGCSVEITLRACGFIDAVFDVSEAGELTVRGSEITCTEVADPPEHAIMSFGCSTQGADQCRADVYGPERLGIRATTLEVAGGSPPDELEAYGLGFLGDLGVLGPNELGVTHFKGAFHRGRTCVPEEPGELLVFSSDLEPRTTIPMPPCPSKLAGLPDRTILVAHHDSHLISQIDRNGEVSRTLKIPTDREIPRSVFDIVFDGTSAFVLSTGTKRDDGVLHEIDLETFSITATISMPPQAGPLAVGRGELYSISNQLDAVLEIREAYRPLVGVAGLCFGSSLNINGFAFDDEHFLVSSSDETAFVYLVDRGGNSCDRSAYFEAVADPRGVANLDAHRYWVSLTDRAMKPTALLAVLDKRIGFVPGHVDVGHGTIDRLISVDGVAFAMLREEGKVVRVELE